MPDRVDAVSGFVVAAGRFPIGDGEGVIRPGLDSKPLPATAGVTAFARSGSSYVVGDSPGLDESPVGADGRGRKGG